MSYRDELGAAQSRIESLERELKEAKSEALVVRSPSAIANRPGQKFAKRWFGGNTRIRGERVIEGEIEETTYALIVECVTEEFDVVGRPSIVPGRLDWSTERTNQNGATTQISISVMVADGKTTIRGDVRLGGLAGAIFGGIGGGVGLGAAMAPAALFFLNPIAGVVGVATWLGGTYAGCRKIFRHFSAKRERQLEKVLDQLEEIATRAPKRNAATEA